MRFILYYKLQSVRQFFLRPQSKWTNKWEYRLERKTTCQCLDSWLMNGWWPPLKGWNPGLTKESHENLFLWLAFDLRGSWSHQMGPKRETQLLLVAKCQTLRQGSSCRDMNEWAVNLHIMSLKFSNFFRKCNKRKNLMWIPWSWGGRPGKGIVEVRANQSGHSCSSGKKRCRTHYIKRWVHVFVLNH